MCTVLSTPPIQESVTEVVMHPFAATLVAGGGKVGRQSEPIDVDAWECEEEGEADSRCWTVTSWMLGAGSAWSSSPAVGAGAGVGLGARSQGATLGLGLPSFLSPHLLQSYDVDSVPLWECQMEAWSLLVCVLHAIEESILSCNKACLVCDKALDFVAIKPSICNAELCLVRTAPLPALQLTPTL